MMHSFANWLKRRKKRPSPGRPSEEETSPKNQEDQVNPDELDDLWTANELGITDQMRKAANSMNPKSQNTPEELDDLWKRLKDQE
jgi:hypothetical protein